MKMFGYKFFSFTLLFALFFLCLDYWLNENIYSISIYLPFNFSCFVNVVYSWKSTKCKTDCSCACFHWFLYLRAWIYWHIFCEIPNSYIGDEHIESNRKSALKTSMNLSITSRMKRKAILHNAHRKFTATELQECSTKIDKYTILPRYFFHS